MAIDLYYCEVSAPCRAVMMTAKMVGVELNLKPLDLAAGDQMKPEFLAINPQHTVPTVDDDGFYLNESRAICAYLVNQYAKDDALYPTEPKVRALVDQRLYFDAGVFYDRFGKLYYPIVLGNSAELDEKAKKDLAEAVGYLEIFLSQNKYAAGDHLTIADIVLVASATSFEATDNSIFKNRPKIQSWLEACKAEITDYAETNEKGAEAFGKWFQESLDRSEASAQESS